MPNQLSDGEMVGVLWSAGKYSAAIQLEEFWNRLLHGGGFTLYCSYPIDIFSRAFQVTGVESVFCDHTHLIPTGTDEALDSSLNRALDEHLGLKADQLRSRMERASPPAWAVLPKAEAKILWLRNYLPEQADAILNLARQHYHVAIAELAA